ncbi:MAG: hypothetical protein ACRDKL_12365 [Solirubrobacteraceae bacterium]
MSIPTRATATAPAVPARAQTLAARLAGLFDADLQIIARLNDAHRRLAAANDRRWTGPVLDPLGLHHEVHSAFFAYQQAAEERRQLGFDVGELSQQLTDTLTNAGHTREQARSANVHELAAGTWQPTQGKETNQ